MTRTNRIIRDEAAQRYVAYYRRIIALEADGNPIQELSDDPIFYANLSFDLAKIGVCGNCLVHQTPLKEG